MIIIINQYALECICLPCTVQRQCPVGPWSYPRLSAALGTVCSSTRPSLRASRTSTPRWTWMAGKAAILTVRYSWWCGVLGSLFLPSFRKRVFYRMADYFLSKIISPFIGGGGLPRTLHFTGHSRRGFVSLVRALFYVHLDVIMQDSVLIWNEERWRGYVMANALMKHNCCCYRRWWSKYEMCARFCNWDHKILL